MFNVLGCEAGTYGFDCLSECGNCEFGAACGAVSGACVTCDPGWLLPLCVDGRLSLDCNSNPYF